MSRGNTELFDRGIAIFRDKSFHTDLHFGLSNPPSRLQNQPLRRPSGKGVLDDVDGVICILFQPLRMAPDLGCDPQTTFPTAFGCATHTGPPYTAIRDPAPATRKTHQSTTHYREPIHPASRLRNPLRRKINVRKRQRPDNE